MRLVHFGTPVLLVTGAMIAIACGGGTAPGKAPSPAEPTTTPAMYNLAVAPDRPSLQAGNESHMSFVKDPKTGKTHLASVRDTTPVPDSLKPDTNDARTYYQAGLGDQFDPAGANAAFYWASRLNPAWAEPYYARWFTLSQAAKQANMLRHKKRPLVVPDSTITHIDSLVLLADSRNPFYDESIALDEVSGNLHSMLSIANAQQRQEVDEISRERMAQGDAPVMGVQDIQLPRMWYIAYAQHHFDSAATMLAAIIKKHPDDIELYVYRAKAQDYLQQYDSATATLGAAVSRIEKRDTTHVLPVYFSREALTYSMGMAQQQAHHDSAARALFQTTVTQNLGFYMAHVRLAGAALTAHDTATALTEARVAAEVRPDDPVVQLFLGASLLTAGHPQEAGDHLQTAITDDPWFALPYYWLGEARLTMHDTANAVKAFQGFLAHAPRHDARRPDAAAALAALQPAGTTN